MKSRQDRMIRYDRVRLKVGEPQEKEIRAGGLGTVLKKIICLGRIRIAKFDMYARCRPGLKERGS